MPHKRSAIDALMPGSGKGTFGNASANITEVLPNNTVNNTDSYSFTKKHRNRPQEEKAIRKTYSFYPSTVRGLEEYADDNRMTYSQVINLALRQLIPRNYFE